MSVIREFITWFRSIFVKRCKHPLGAREYRFRFEGEWGVAFEECTLCGEIFDPD